MALVVLIATLAVAAAEPSLENADPDASQAPSRDEAAEHPRIDPIVLDVEGLDRAALRDAIDLRLPARTLVSPQAPREEGEQAELLGYLQVRPHPEGGVALALILGDRRAYYRRIETQADLAPREVATTLENLVAGIEAGRVMADAIDVAVPEPQPEPEPEPEPGPDPDPRPPPAEPVAPIFELGLALAPMVTFALPPSPPLGLAAGGAALRLDLRHRTGALACTDIRGAGLLDAGYGLARMRIGLGGGWAWRRGSFELVTAALFDLEPAWVRRDGDRVPLLTEDGAARQTAFVLGGRLRLEPTWRHAFSETLALRVGGVLEAGGGALPDIGIARIRSRDTDPPRDVFRLGGLELSLGLQLGLWWGV